ncbi:hypothetical protein ACVWZ4_001175 [Bradyrhizobium sp. USDA 4472]
MTYTITCHRTEYGRKYFSVQRPSAREALSKAEFLEMSDIQIDYIDTPTDGRVDMRTLRTLAEKERA